VAYYRALPSFNIDLYPLPASLFLSRSAPKLLRGPRREAVDSVLCEHFRVRAMSFLHCIFALFVFPDSDAILSRTSAFVEDCVLLRVYDARRGEARSKLSLPQTICTHRCC